MSHTTHTKEKPTPLFLSYAVQLAFRLALFSYGVYLFVTNPDLLNVRERFGLAHGFNFVDFVFLAILADFATKFFRRAKISMGSLKQYRLYHMPTEVTLCGGREALVGYLKNLFAQGKLTLTETRKALLETTAGLRALTRQVLRDVDVLHLLKFKDEDLTAPASTRAILYRDRAREIIPVAIAWIALNAAVASALGTQSLLTQPVAMVWCLFFFVFDMVCVVIWCPIQIVLMRNRCCTTCQIFNWDAIMVATPLFFVGGWFGGVLLALAIIVLVRWELAALRHPERFDERTNASLACANCKDKLCYFRPPIRRPLTSLPEQDS